MSRRRPNVDGRGVTKGRIRPGCGEQVVPLNQCDVCGAANPTLPGEKAATSCSSCGSALEAFTLDRVPTWENPREVSNRSGRRPST